jgi:hypothetical protein
VRRRPDLPERGTVLGTVKMLWGGSEETYLSLHGTQPHGASP